MWWSWRLQDDQPTDELPASRLRSNNGQALRQAALAGFGIVMQAELMLADEVHAGCLVALLEAHLPPARSMHLLYPRDRRQTPKLRTFIEYVLTRFSPCPYT